MITPDQWGGVDMAKSSEITLIISGKPVQCFNQDSDILDLGLCLGSSNPM